MNPISALSLARIVLGTLTFVRPGLAATLFGFDRTGHPQLPTMSRLFASREIALGATTLLASGDTRRRMVTAGLLVDGADAVAGAVGLREKSASRLTGAAIGVAGIGAVIAALRELR